MVIHDSLELAVHVQALPVDTLMVAAPPSGVHLHRVW